MSDDFADKFSFELKDLHGSFYQDGMLHSGMLGVDGLKAHVTPHNNPNRVMPIFEAPIFDRKYYELLADKARSPHLWIFDENDNKWCLRETITEENQAISQEETAKYWQGNK